VNAVLLSRATRRDGDYAMTIFDEITVSFERLSRTQTFVSIATEWEVRKGAIGAPSRGYGNPGSPGLMARASIVGQKSGFHAPALKS
jgi:hypothetical protein